MNNRPEAPEKWICSECLEVSFHHLSAQNPFDIENIIHGCPHCKEVNTLLQACHHPGCTSVATGGYPNELGYRYAWLCHKHYYPF